MKSSNLVLFINRMREIETKQMNSRIVQFLSEHKYQSP